MSFIIWIFRRKAVKGNQQTPHSNPVYYQTNQAAASAITPYVHQVSDAAPENHYYNNTATNMDIYSNSSIAHNKAAAAARAATQTAAVTLVENDVYDTTGVASFSGQPAAEAHSGGDNSMSQSDGDVYYEAAPVQAANGGVNGGAVMLVDNDLYSS